MLVTKKQKKNPRTAKTHYMYYITKATVDLLFNQKQNGQIATSIQATFDRTRETSNVSTLLLFVLLLLLLLFSTSHHH